MAIGRDFILKGLERLITGLNFMKINPKSFRTKILMGIHVCYCIESIEEL